MFALLSGWWHDLIEEMSNILNSKFQSKESEISFERLEFGI
jgi:hypothetical protein